jgi:hypothetical protein
VKKKIDQYLIELNSLKRKEDEALTMFNMRFHIFYYNMPKDIQHSETTTILYYIKDQHPKLVFYLRERRSSSLGQLFVDSREIEDNFWACDKIRDQEHEEEYECQRSYFSLHSFQYCDPSFSYFNFPLDLKTPESNFSTIQ